MLPDQLRADETAQEALNRILGDGLATGEPFPHPIPSNWLGQLPVHQPSADPAEREHTPADANDHRDVRGGVPD